MPTTRHQYSILLPMDVHNAFVQYRKEHGITNINAFLVDLIRKAVGGKK